MNGPPRLCDETLALLPSEVRRPGYDRRALGRGVVHIGPGAFHRAHQAVVFDDLIREGDRRWGITAVSLRSAAARDALAPQDGLYTLDVRQGDRSSLRVIGAVKDVLTLDEDPRPVVEAIAAPQAALVTLTITEAGYVTPQRRGPATAVGLITVGLAMRRDRGLGGVTVLSCDNLSGNGERVGALVSQTALGIEPELADWIDQNVAFPSTMVDRITPAASEADIAALTARTGVLDRAVVRTESFSQWVVQDWFAGPRPDFARAGVQVVADVEPFERAKLRMLNGAHSAMAYLGTLGGLEFVHEFVAEPTRASLVRRLWDEVETTLPAGHIDTPAYRRALASRFADPAIRHRLSQIAVDGSQKLPQRLLAPLAERITRGLDSPALMLALAAWMKHLSGEDDFGRKLEIRDPLAAMLRRRMAGLRAPGSRVSALLTLDQIFPPTLAASPALRMGLTAALGLLDRLGARRTIASLA